MNIRQVAGTVAIGVSALAATAAVAAQHLATAAISASAPANTASVAAQQPAAADHLWFRLDPVSLGGGWKLRANATSPDYYLTSPSTVPVTPAEIISVALDRRLSRRADESHVAALHLAEASIAFDGRDGRWATRGTSPQTGGSPLVERWLAVDMTIKAVGEPEQLGPGEYLPWSCHGPSLARVRVTLTGSFALRTGMETFKTIRRTRLTGTITYNQGGPLECGQPAPTTCEPTTYLSSQYDTLASSSRGINAFLYIDRGRRFLSLQVRDRDRMDAHHGAPRTRRPQRRAAHDPRPAAGKPPAPRHLQLRRERDSGVCREGLPDNDGQGLAHREIACLLHRLGLGGASFLRRDWRLHATYRVSVPL